jgi:hypothetical protein
MEFISKARTYYLGAKILVNNSKDFYIIKGHPIYKKPSYGAIHEFKLLRETRDT